ncbi:MAG: PilN domain-containing protein [Acidobacteriota bacterium]
MIRINLIREARAGTREAAAPRATAAMSAPSAANINTILIVAMVIAGILIGGGWWYMKKRELEAKQQLVVSRRAEAQALEAIIAEVEQFQKRKDALQKRISLINDLKKNQKNPVRIMDKISALLPDLVWLTTMSVDGTHITLAGKALNPNAFATYLENIKRDPTFDEPVVDQISRGVEGTTVVYTWGMSFNFTYAAADQQPAVAGTGLPGTNSQNPAVPVPSATGTHG